MENTFKGYEVEELIDNAIFGLKAATEQYIATKLDGMLNTENALVIDENTTLYYVKGLYTGVVGGRDMSRVEFILIEGKSVAVIEG